MKQTEIDLKDVFLYACRHWRAMLVALFICAILMDLYGFKNNMNSFHEYENLVAQSDTAMASGDVETYNALQPSIAAATVTVKPSIISVKYIVIGMFLGVCAVGAYFCVRYIFKGYIRTEHDIREGFDMDVYNTISVRTPKNRLDRWIYKLRTGKREIKEPEEQIEYTASLMANIIEKKEAKNVAVISSVSTEKNEYLKMMVEKLNERKLETRFEILEAVLEDKTVLEKMKEYDSIILMEEANVSHISDVIEEVKICKLQNMEILGAVLFN